MALTDKLTAIADAIRAKTGNPTVLTLDQMPEQIASISSSSSSELFLKSVSGKSFKLEASDLQGISKIGKYAFAWTLVTSVVLPSGIKGIEIGGFYACEALTSITLNNDLETISGAAFQSTGLQEITIPASVTKISNQAFWTNNLLTSVTFKGTPTEIGTGVFNSCYDLEDIYVPWAEGAVANAPWGADYATIHYNSEV